jgi:hypothetical protein
MKRNIWRKLTLVLALAGVTATAMPAMAWDFDEEEHQGLVMDDYIQAPSRLQVDFRAVKDIYRVGEPITFRARSNMPVYLYLFNAAEDGQELAQIFPNRYERTNLLRPDSTVLFPSRKSAFRSDQPGVERVVLVASERKLNPRSDSIRELINWRDSRPLEGSGENVLNDNADYRSATNGIIVREIDVLVQSEGW